MKEKVAESRHRDVIDAGLRGDDVSSGFGHLLVVDEPVAMDEEHPRKFQASGQEKCRPIDPVELEDVFADHVDGWWPYRLDIKTPLFTGEKPKVKIGFTMSQSECLATVR